MSWWVYVLIGVGVLIFTLILYAFRDSPGVEFEGGSPGCVTAVFVVVSLGMIVAGIWGYFNPAVLSWIEWYSETAEHAENAWDVVSFLFWQVVFLGMFLYFLLWRRDEPDMLPGLAIILTLFAIYWIFVLATGRFDAWFREPFRYLYHLVTG